MSEPRNYTKKQLRQKWLQNADQQIQQKQINNQFKKIYQLQQVQKVKNYMNKEKYFLALKYIETQFPEFKSLHSKTYNWLKRVENTNLNQNNVENLTKINISEFRAPIGNIFESVDIYNTFSTKRGGTRKKIINKRKTRKNR
jgi:hypothetical protein